MSEGTLYAGVTYGKSVISSAASFALSIFDIWRS